LDHEIDKKILLHNDLPSTFKDTLLRFIQLKKEAPHKSPFVAGVLSGLIPGLGKIYTGFYEDGIAAFIVTGLLGYATYANIKNDHPARAYLSGAFTLFFYSGTVYGSYISAEKYNWAQLVNINLRFNSIMLNENLIPYISETP
jgi:TM2 domain-containing membrane protein YozV